MNWLRTFLRKLNRFNDRNYPKYSIDMWINNSNFMSVCCRLINTKIGSNGFICINICKIISFQRKIPKYLCILGRDVSNHVPIKVLWFIQFRFYLWPLCHGRTSISTCYPLTSTEIQIDISINFLLEPQLKFKYEYWKSGWRLIFC